MRFIPVYIAAIFVLVITKMQENPSFKEVGFVGILFCVYCVCVCERETYLPS